MRKGSDLFRLVSSATIPHLTGVKLKTLPIPVPPIELQEEFKNVYTRSVSHKARLKSQCRMIGALFDSLVQRAFRGEL